MRDQFNAQRAVRVPPSLYAYLARGIAPRYRGFLSPEAFDADALARIGAECYADGATGAAGFYIVAGDLRGLFALPHAPKGIGAALAREAGEFLGARTLDCFAGFLPALYASLGWRETGRAPFDPAQAPACWNPADGAPDVVFMARGEG